MLNSLPGHATCLAAALEVPNMSLEHKHTTCDWSQLCSGFSFQHCPYAFSVRN